ncbi:TerD family protein [Streptomyces sp. NPDC051940]|uniref:TerD family protein n=1 Tax=Streptomyces sp. NPDC051940 TaxID=3155675 RepID=UPI003436F47D
MTLPRGSELPLPEGRRLRLFLHWTESEASGRTDLDLSLAFFNASWEHIGTCDYTHLRFGTSAAVHSGDLTSAPPPDGASEFVDLDLAALEQRGVRYAVAAVYSYNSVPFTELADAFAGFMVRGDGAGAPFDPGAVEQRFDLAGSNRAMVPLVVDVSGRTMRWLDIMQGVTGDHHAVHRHAGGLASLGRALTDLFASGSRVGLGELAVWQAAARAAVVALRHADGSVTTYRRRSDEDAAAFAARIGGPDADAPADPEGAQLAYLYRGDIRPAPGAEVYALHPVTLDASVVRLIAAADVAGTGSEA